MQTEWRAGESDLVSTSWCGVIRLQAPKGCWKYYTAPGPSAVHELAVVSAWALLIPGPQQLPMLWIQTFPLTGPTAKLGLDHVGYCAHKNALPPQQRPRIKLHIFATARSIKLFSKVRNTVPSRRLPLQQNSILVPIIIISSQCDEIA